MLGVSLAVLAIGAVVAVRLVPKADRARAAADAAAEVAAERTSSSRRPATPATAPEEEPATTAVATTAPPARGSHASPLGIGEVFTIRNAEDGDIDVAVTGIVTDALPAILAENQFNSPPPAGQQYVLIGFVATYHAGTAQQTLPSLLGALSVSVFGQSGVELNTYSCEAVVPDRLDAFTELLDGGTLSGNECILTPVADAAGPLLVRVKEAICFRDCDAVWVKVQ